MLCNKAPPTTEQNHFFFTYTNIQENQQSCFQENSCHVIYGPVKLNTVLCDRHMLVINARVDFIQHNA